jgi:hypothetical protein
MDVTVHGLHASTLSEAAIRTRAAYEAISRPTGQRPKVTLDAATFIAATSFASISDELHLQRWDHNRHLAFPTISPSRKTNCSA